MLRTKSFFWKLFFSYIGILLLTMILVMPFMFRAINHFEVEKIKTDLYARAIFLERYIQTVVDDKTVDLKKIINDLGEKSATRVSVISEEGRVLADSNEDILLMDNHLNRPEIQLALNNQLGHATRYSTTLEKTMMYLALPLSEVSGDVFIRVSVPLTSIKEKSILLFKRIFLVLVLATFFSVLVAIVLSRKITKPLKALTEVADAFSKEDFNQDLPKATSLELLNLNHSMKNMAALLRDRIQTISKSENEKDYILSTMMEGIITVNSSYCVTEMNAAAKTLLDCDEKNPIGKQFQDVVDEETLMTLVLKAEKDKAVHQQVIKCENPTLYLQANISPLIKDMTYQGALIVLHDITKIKQLERTRQDFVANVSHELKTPITLIKSSVETLLTSDIKEKKDQQEFLRIIQSHSDRLHIIIDDLLKLSQLEAGEEVLQLDIRKGVVNHSIRQAIEVCKEKADKHNITIELSTKKEFQACFNHELLEQAVINMIDNAIKYSPSKGVILVTISSKKEEIEIKVSDDGKGIPKKHLSKLFERFYRVDPARSRELGGTGLGLAIVKHIAQFHKGRVSVKSKENLGSHFSLFLPKKIQSKEKGVAV